MELFEIADNVSFHLPSTVVYHIQTDCRQRCVFAGYPDYIEQVLQSLHGFWR